MILSIVFWGFVVSKVPWKAQGPYFIDTQKAMAAYAPMIHLNKNIQEKDQAWKERIRQREQALMARADSLAKQNRLIEFDVLNLEINVERHKAIDSTGLWASQEMTRLVDRFNGEIVEFSRKKGYQILFGTGNSTIVYGSGTMADKTAEFIDFLENHHEK